MNLKALTLSGLNSLALGFKLRSAVAFAALSTSFPPLLILDILETSLCINLYASWRILNVASSSISILLIGSINSCFSNTFLFKSDR